MVRQVRLLACLALCACACAVGDARPDNNIGLTSILKTEYLNRKKILDGNSFNIKLFYRGAATKAKPAQDERPVNERYPHAVLFGGTCGGTIISPKWVLTAAHCTLFTGGKYVLAGTNNSEDGSGVTRRVKQLYIHPRFSVGPYWLNAKRYNLKQVAARFDFLLAELEQPLPIDGVKIAAAKLNDVSKLVPGINVGYAGYGAEHHGETMRHHMHGMDLYLLSDEECSVLEEYDSQDMICMKGRPPRFDSACNGDSGSGVVNEQGVLVGIASWVENDAIECRNGAIVYCSKVAVARDWIRKVAGV